MLTAWTLEALKLPNANFLKLKKNDNVRIRSQTTEYVDVDEKGALINSFRGTEKAEHMALVHVNKEIPKYMQNINSNLVNIVKSLLTIIYGDRNYARFAALETIARVPYFSYTSVLHLYETLGWWRKKDYIKLHFAESWNEMHHLLIMEALGGSDLYVDRFISQHMAFFYYWIVVLMYMSSPAVAYDFMKHVENHAFETYDKFLHDHEQELKSSPAPQVAIDYYQNGDLSLFDAFHRSTVFGDSLEKKDLRRPIINNLYDVFYNIRADEAEHANTMMLLQSDVLERKEDSKV
jgi:ubiquinol oxidase